MSKILQVQNHATDGSCLHYNKRDLCFIVTFCLVGCWVTQYKLLTLEEYIITYDFTERKIAMNSSSEKHLRGFADFIPLALKL